MATSDAEKAFVEEIKEWLYSFTKDIESEWEEKDSLHKLRSFISKSRSHPDIKDCVTDFTSNFLLSKFEDQLPRLCLRYTLHSHCGWVHDNCFTESENAAIAKDPLGPKPNMRLHVSGDTILQHTDERFRTLTRDAFDHYLESKAQFDDETEKEALERTLSHAVVDHANTNVVNQFIASSKLLGCEITKAKDLEAGRRIFTFRNSAMDYSHITHHHPVYQRTRIVVARRVRIDGVDYVCIQCGCGYFMRHKCPCRHVYGLINREPEATDLFPDQFKKYEVLYGEDEEYSRKCDERTKMLQYHKGEFCFIYVYQYIRVYVQAQRSVSHSSLTLFVRSID